jgi:hypothetical protein
MKDAAEVAGQLARIVRDQPLPDERVSGHDGTPVSLRGRADEVVTVLIRHGDCAECDAYEVALREARDAFDRCSGRLVVVDGEKPRLLITDRDAVVYEIAEGGEHALLSVEDVVASLEFLASRCPECGAPEGPWQDLAGQSGF